MAKKKQIEIEEEETSKTKQHKEADLILLFNLNRIAEYQTPLLKEWLDVTPPEFTAFETELFTKKLKEAQNKLIGWSEEDLKMKFISDIIKLGYLEDGNGIVTFFDKQISATVEGTLLTVKADFMMARGLLNVLKNPYFHFQEYKPQINPKGEPMAQLLEAFMIAQVKNKTKKMPLYGVETIGKQWNFVIMEDKEYCISKSFDCTDKDDLLKIIAMLRKFRWILETRLMK